MSAVSETNESIATQSFSRSASEPNFRSSKLRHRNVSLIAPSNAIGPYVVERGIQGCRCSSCELSLAMAKCCQMISNPECDVKLFELLVSCLPTWN